MSHSDIHFYHIYLLAGEKRIRRPSYLGANVILAVRYIYISSALGAFNVFGLRIIYAAGRLTKRNNRDSISGLTYSHGLLQYSM